MMDPNKINRPVATVDRDAWFLRFYIWLWAADVDKVDFCRLFWGYVLAVPFFLFRFLVLIPLLLIWDGLMYMKNKGIWKIMDGIEWFLSRTVFPPIRFAYTSLLKIIPQGDPQNRPEREPSSFSSPFPEPLYSRRPRKPSKVKMFFKSLRETGGERFLAGVGKTADNVIEVAQTTWPYTKWFFIAVGVLVAGVIAAVCGYLLWILIGVMPVVLGAIWIAISASASGIAWLTVVIMTSQYAWMVPLAIIGIVGLGVLIAAMLNSRPAKTAGVKTKEATLGFGGAMKMGAKSVKYRTCPVIKVEE